MKKSAMKHFHIKSIFAALLLVPVAASAAEIRIVGLFTGKAVVVVDDGKPRTLSLGQTSPEGIKLIDAKHCHWPAAGASPGPASGHPRARLRRLH